MPVSTTTTAKAAPDDAAPACSIEGAPRLPRGYDAQAIAAALAWVYRGDDAVETYCGCAFGADLWLKPGCGYQNAEDPQPRVAWEPIVPPSRFGVYRRCWQQVSMSEGPNAAALEHCAAKDAEFRAMLSDLYNYHPAIEGLALARSDNAYNQAQGELRAFGSCDFEMQSDMGKRDHVEPPPAVLGDLARAYLYMAAHHAKGKDWKIKLTREQRTLYEAWSAADPPDAREKRRACRIEAIQGWAHPLMQ